MYDVHSARVQGGATMYKYIVRTCTMYMYMYIHNVCMYYVQVPCTSIHFLHRSSTYCSADKIAPARCYMCGGACALRAACESVCECT